MGLERVGMAVEDEGLTVPQEAPVDAFVVAVGEPGRARIREVARLLREAGLAADRSFQDRPLGAQLRMADRAGARFAVIVGEREAAAGTVTVRRLEDGRQEEFGLDQAIGWITTQAEADS